MAASISGLQPWLQPWARWLVSLAPGAVIASTYRSYSEQLALWNNRANNPLPVAPPGRSWHQYGRAFDINASPRVLAQLGATWRRYGGTWSPADEVHFQA